MEQILEAQSGAWGFVGTIRHHAEAKVALEVALGAITAKTGASTEGAQAFLNSRSGRYFADEVVNYLALSNTLEQAIHNAADRWQNWTITPKMARDTGIPVGLPYLTGMVMDAQIHAEV